METESIKLLSGKRIDASKLAILLVINEYRCISFFIHKSERELPKAQIGHTKKKPI